MLVYIFSGPNSYYGFTQVEDGTNLPSEYGPWQFRNKIDLQLNQSRIALNVTEALKAIEDRGFYLNQASITFDVKMSNA